MHLIFVIVFFLFEYGSFWRLVFFVGESFVFTYGPGFNGVEETNKHYDFRFLTSLNFVFKVSLKHFFGDSDFGKGYYTSIYSFRNGCICGS